MVIATPKSAKIVLSVSKQHTGTKLSDSGNIRRDSGIPSAKGG